MQQAGWVHGVLIFSIGCHSILLWRLWADKLARTYRFLTMFLAAELVQTLVVLPVPQDTSLYLWSYLISTPVILVLAYVVVLELYRLTLEEYPGIASVGRRAVTWSMGLALAISTVYAVPDLRTTNGHFAVLRIYPIVERSTVLGLLLFLVLIQLFLFHYRLPLSRNRMVYATGYALYFGVTIAQDIVWTALGIQVDSITLWIVAAGGVILLAGAGLLSHEGEAKVVLKPVDADSDRARLQQQLADMNRMLSRAARGRG